MDTQDPDIPRPELAPRTEDELPPRLARLLVAWYSACARDLPWRRTRNPYAIWISEVMLQQTQVKTVIPYWERWMKELPNARNLAAAPLERVLKLWEGLGYYSRARNLQAAARVIVTDHQGRFPGRHEDILALPGIGPYTAGAICSLAYDQPEAILDGNIIRVLTRLFAWSDDPKGTAMQRRLWSMAGRLVSAAGALAGEFATPHGSLNQALMELGATVCKPREPACGGCPVAAHCRALAEGRVGELPASRPRVAATECRHVVFVIRCRGRFLVRQRAAHGVVNAGLWEFPSEEVHRVVMARLDGWAGRWAGRPLRSVAVLGTLVHHITRYRHRLTVCGGEAGGASGEAAGCHWLTVEEMLGLAFAGAHRKILTRFVVDNPSRMPSTGSIP